MPIIQQISQSRLQAEKLAEGSKEKFIRKLKGSGSEMLFFLCKCGHLNTGHEFCEGKCAYPKFGKLNEKCDCIKFEQIEFSLEIKLTKLDLFKFENPNCATEEFPQFWIDFEKWENEKIRI